jgi:hypothetical protein
MSDNPPAHDGDEQVRGAVVRISYKILTASGKDDVETTVVPSFMAKWIAADLPKRRGVKPESISIGKELPVRVDQYNAAVKLREAMQRVDLAALKVAVAFASSNQHDTLHPETCLAVMELAQRGVEEMRAWVDDPLNYMVGKGVTTAIPFPPRKQ